MTRLNFLTPEDQKISNEFKKNGFIIRDVANIKSLDWIQSKFVNQIKKVKKNKYLQVLNTIHTKIKQNTLNNFRLKIYNKINQERDYKFHYFQLARPYLEAIAGNELAMQKKINLSIQLPRDETSLLSLHSDVWAGDSPFEVVAWIPLVNCFKTKAGSES